MSIPEIVAYTSIALCSGIMNAVASKKLVVLCFLIVFLINVVVVSSFHVVGVRLGLNEALKNGSEPSIDLQQGILTMSGIASSHLNIVFASFLFVSISLLIKQWRKS